MNFGKAIDLDYNDVVSMCNNLSDVVGTYNPDMIVGLSRGGLIPAVHVSHKLGIAMRPIIWQTRDGGVKQLDDEIMKAIHEDKKTVVFVDDINDTGHTFNEVWNTYCGVNGLNVFCVALVEKSSSTFTTDASILNINDPRWIIFPWEE